MSEGKDLMGRRLGRGEFRRLGAVVGGAGLVAGRASMAEAAPHEILPLTHLDPPLIARWTDHPKHLGNVVAGVRDAVRRRAPVVDAVSLLEFVDALAEMDVDPA